MCRKALVWSMPSLGVSLRSRTPAKNQSLTSFSHFEANSGMSSYGGMRCITLAGKAIVISSISCGNHGLAFIGILLWRREAPESHQIEQFRNDFCGAVVMEPASNMQQASHSEERKNQ